MASTSVAERSRGILRRIDAGICELTLLELVEAVCEVTEDDREVMATVLHMLVSGRVRLRGNFRDAGPDDLRSWAESA